MGHAALRLLLLAACTAHLAAGKDLSQTYARAHIVGCTECHLNEDLEHFLMREVAVGNWERTTIELTDDASDVTIRFYDSSDKEVESEKLDNYDYPKLFALMISKGFEQTEGFVGEEAYEESDDGEEPVWKSMTMEGGEDGAAEGTPAPAPAPAAEEYEGYEDPDEQPLYNDVDYEKYDPAEEDAGEGHWGSVDVGDDGYGDAHAEL